MTGKFQQISRHLYNFQFTLFKRKMRPDIVAWSDSKKCVLLIELTVPWEENREEAHERKKNRYESLRADCVEKGWICHVIPIEVGCRGFIGHSVISFLSKIGITGRSLKVASNRLQNTARYASSWIWSKARKFFSMKVIPEESPFLCDYVRNGYCKRVITSTAESKRVFFFFLFKSQTALRK